MPFCVIRFSSAVLEKVLTKFSHVIISVDAVEVLTLYLGSTLGNFMMQALSISRGDSVSVV